ncbi:hypothetical protein [Sphingobium sp.]|uniref:hypothetical protein n=1 Tax=Sphingobium sp. TaxID=1912891 RepID=UPI003B3AE495
MLEGYFDDSGTHMQSNMVVWGGLLGETSQFEVLRTAWKEALTEPIPGKSPVKAFHAAHIAASLKEFCSYAPPERDLVFKRFRDIILSCNLIPVSFGIIKSDWDCACDKFDMKMFGTAEQFAFMSCTLSAHRFAEIGKCPVSMCFDQGALGCDADRIIDAGKSTIGLNGSATFMFKAVAEECCLQAADMVAYEAYRFGNSDIALGGAAKPRLHFQRMLEGVPDAYGFVMRKAEIERLFEASLAIMKDGLPTEPTRRPGFQNIFGALYGLEG